MTNRTFEDLERRSTNLNRKKFAKWFLLLLAVAGIIFLVVANFMGNKKLIKQKITVIKQEKIVPIKPKPQKQQPKPTYNTILLKPTIVIPKIEKKVKKVQEISKVQKPKEIIREKLKIVKEPKKLKIEVKSLDNEESLLKSYSGDESFNSALKLSDYYFKNKKYEKAIYYSKKANHYKPSSFKPWLIYAQAKIGQNKKEEAIKAIETFLSYFNSNEAEKLLIKLKSNK